ncbi:mucoidy inhibitor MuiA family protein [Mucilaginibacter aquatilis]|nr:mucoidy inhibitor MuiA family protein [Mucilaginibacter aquatilis]
MSKQFLTSIFLFVLVFAARADQKVPTKVQKVTVFLNGAQVTRTATVNVAAGTSTLRFEGISPDIDVQSIQVKSAGDFTILSVKHELDFLNQQTRQKRVEELLAQQAQLRQKIQLQNSTLAIYKEEENMLIKNQVVSGQNSNLDVVKLKQALDFQTARLTEIRKKEIIVNNAIAQLDAEMQKYNKQISDVNKGNTRATSNVLVTISSKAALNSVFTLTYVARNASWFPTYDIRAKNINSLITVAYKANVSQQCGEDWSNIKLTLSTGNPTASGSKPELQPYYLNLGMVYAGQALSITNVTGVITGVDDGKALAGVTVKVKGTSIGAVTDANGRYSIQIPQGGQYLEYSYIGYEVVERFVTLPVINVSLKPATEYLNDVVVIGYGRSNNQYKKENLAARTPGLMLRGTSSISTNPLVVQKSENQTNVEFTIANPYSIPSDGKQYLVEINQLNIPAEYEYYTAPKLSTDVFLTAKLTNWNQYNFLSGEANLFFEGTFIGKSLLNTSSTADTLNLSLGTDKNIIVTRTLQKDLKDRGGLLGSNRKETRDWLISVKNRKAQQVKLLVEDQLPVAQNSAIEVETQEASGAKVDAITGKTSWAFDLKPLDEKKLRLKYQVKYPKNQNVIVQ